MLDLLTGLSVESFSSSIFNWVDREERWVRVSALFPRWVHPNVVRSSEGSGAR